MFDRWVRTHLKPGQHFITSYAFANTSLKWIRTHGGTTFIDAGNSHPRVFWDLLTEEQKRWGSPYPPISPHYSRLCRETVEHTDYVFTQSEFVRDSFLREGMDPSRVLEFTIPMNLGWFRPAEAARPASRPLTLLNTGALCLRKGTPYLLEAFRLVLEKEPAARLRLSQSVRDDAKGVLSRYAGLPIDWSPYLNLQFEDQRKQYVERFQTSDIFVFPSIEDGFAIVVAEALACGLQVITTKNTGASDLVEPGENGEIVPIRDPQALADAIIKLWPGIRQGLGRRDNERIRGILGFENFEKTVMQHLQNVFA
jgi:glycosyltransferase involved in cell wall biosynthesis